MIVRAMLKYVHFNVCIAASTAFAQSFDVPSRLRKPYSILITVYSTRNNTSVHTGLCRILATSR